MTNLVLWICGVSTLLFFLPDFTLGLFIYWVFSLKLNQGGVKIPWANNFLFLLYQFTVDEHHSQASLYSDWHFDYWIMPSLPKKKKKKPMSQSPNLRIHYITWQRILQMWLNWGFWNGEIILGYPGGMESQRNHSRETAGSTEKQRPCCRLRGWRKWP